MDVSTMTSTLLKRKLDEVSYLMK